jgi:hypothetical protein
MSCYAQCQAFDYGDCYLRIDDYDVIFQYRDAKGRQQPDEIEKVSLCQTHYEWLNKIHQGEPLKMRGEAPQYALHDDLFSHFAEKKRMYTLMKVDFDDGQGKDEEVKYYLFNGRDVDAMRKVIQEWFPNKDSYIRSYEEGFFHTTFHYNADTKDCDQVVIEVKDITGELALAALANNGLSHVHMMTPEGTKVSISASAYTWLHRAETEPLYAAEPMPELFKRFFTKKQEAYIYHNFEECTEFIESEIDKSIIDWTKVRANSPHTEQVLFEISQRLKEALLQKDDTCIKTMQDACDITPDVLWVIYINANHRLFASSDHKNDLTKNKTLVDLFVAQGLEKDLLALAIAGERERYLFVKRRAHYNTLFENEFVVKYLVPRIISSTDIIYKSDHIELTALAYWNYYDNTTTHMGGGFSYLCNNIETFEKNETIHLYLELHTLTPLEEVIVVSDATQQQRIGKLDSSVLSEKALLLYNQVKENGHHDAEFVIFGYQDLFEYRPISVVDLRQCTVEEGEKIIPGVTAIYEEKKRKLRAGDYEEWQKMNETLLKYKYE